MILADFSGHFLEELKFMRLSKLPARSARQSLANDVGISIVPTLGFAQLQHPDNLTENNKNKIKKEIHAPSIHSYLVAVTRDLAAARARLQEHCMPFDDYHPLTIYRLQTLPAGMSFRTQKHSTIIDPRESFKPCEQGCPSGQKTMKVVVVICVSNPASTDVLPDTTACGPLLYPTV